MQYSKLDTSQALVSTHHKWPLDLQHNNVASRIQAVSDITDQAAAMLADQEDAVLTLWDLPVVKAAIAERRLRLDEAAS